MKNSKADQEVSITLPCSLRKLRRHRPKRPIQDLKISGNGLLHEKHANELCTWPGFQSFGAWIDVSKAAMRAILSLESVQDIYATSLTTHGSLDGAVCHGQLRSFSCHWMSARDLLKILDYENLQTLRAQDASLSQRVIDRIAQKHSLSELVLESTALTDGMLQTIAASRSIEHLFIGATKVTGTGLRVLQHMQQLRSLDIWALDLDAVHLDVLKDLPNLEYLSIGGYSEQTRLRSEEVLPYLTQLPKLKNLWLDGIALSTAQQATLEERLEYLQVTL